MRLRLLRFFSQLLLDLSVFVVLVGGFNRVGSAQSGDSPTIHFPLVMRDELPTPAPRVNVPWFDGNVGFTESAIFWFGRVTPSENYADVRIGYNNSELKIHVAIFDRLTWYDGTPSVADLTNWDAVTLLLKLNGNRGGAPDANSYRFVGQLRWWEDPLAYQAAYQGNGSGWSISGAPFTTQAGWVSYNTPGDMQDDRGWLINFRIPFTSLGLSAPPPQGTLWGLGVILHDRDNEAGPPLAVKTWPISLNQDQPRSWGQLVFGLPEYSPPAVIPGGSLTIRQGLNGALVKDAHVGGHTVCGEQYNPDFFNGWGDANFAGYTQVNIQNQANLADWPCFSKYYVTFPLNGIPAGKQILSAILTLYQFGNSYPQEANSSLIQVLTVKEDWNENTITWNNAPYAWENVSRSWVGVLMQYPGLPGVPRQWDVTRAVAEAYQQGVPLRLALYSADGPMHSGKYFFSSDMDDYAQSSRPSLTVTWGP